MSRKIILSSILGIALLLTGCKGKTNKSVVESENNSSGNTSESSSSSSSSSEEIKYEVEQSVWEEAFSLEHIAFESNFTSSTTLNGRTVITEFDESKAHVTIQYSGDFSDDLYIHFLEKIGDDTVNLDQYNHYNEDWICDYKDYRSLSAYLSDCGIISFPYDEFTFDEESNEYVCEKEIIILIGVNRYTHFKNIRVQFENNHLKYANYVYINNVEYPTVSEFSNFGTTSVTLPEVVR